jgi:hypothetical protein
MYIHKKHITLSGLSAIRAMVLISLAIMGASGVAYASLQSQSVTLMGNTIQTASAGLQVSSDGTTYAASQTGFNFSDLIPGGSAVPATGNLAYLRNVGGATLALKMMVSSVPSNTDNVDFSKVHVIITPISGGSVQNFTLDALISSNTTGGLNILSAVSVPAGSIYSFRMQVQMDADAFSSSNATINNLDFSFVGVAVTS